MAHERSGLPAWRLKRVLAYIDGNLGEKLTLPELAAVIGITRMHFAAQFRISTGMSPHQYIISRRIERAKQMLTETRDPLIEIALGVGFKSQAHFTTVFARLVGQTPRKFRVAHSTPRPRVIRMIEGRGGESAGLVQ